MPSTSRKANISLVTGASAQYMYLQSYNKLSQIKLSKNSTAPDSPSTVIALTLISFIAFENDDDESHPRIARRFDGCLSVVRVAVSTLC